MVSSTATSLVVLSLLLTIGEQAARGQRNAGYYGKLIGKLDSDYYGIGGDVYAVDARTLFIRGFSYDGSAEDALFYAGSTDRIGAEGFIIPNEDGSTDSLSRSYANQDLTLTLPDGKTLKEIRWVTVWNRAFSEAYGQLRIPSGFDYPRPQRMAALSGIHKVSSDRLYVVDAQTFLLPNFTYDGAAPDAFFWVGTGSKPNQDGIQVPDENGKVDPLRRYDTKTLVLTLPGDLTVFDVDWLSVWCRAYAIDFGHIRVPKNLNVPPSLKMLGVAPQAKLNCEVLWDDLALEVRWAVAGETIVIQLVGKLDDGQYVAFGPSGDAKRTRMIGADVAIGWLDRATGKGYVHDHYMTSKSPCQAGKGVCQDTQSARGANNIRLLNAALVNDYVMLTYQRPLKAQDENDKSIITNGTQAVIWAVGSLDSNNQPTYHKLRNKGDLIIDFGRSPFWNCPAPEDPNPTTRAPVEFDHHNNHQRGDHHSPSQEDAPWPPVNGNAVGNPRDPAPPKSVAVPPVRSSSPKPTVVPAVTNKPPWYVPAIECYEPENHVFYAHIGPNGGSQGYNAITGQNGWGISWFINGLLIPEVTVVRGQTYTFVVEGGQDLDRPSRYHPFYITDDPEGGYEFKTPAERARFRVFAGVRYDREGSPAPTAKGRLCEWVEDPSHPADSFTSFGAYQRTLKLHCEEGEPALLQWTPDRDTPDVVYYQCYTHRYLGWKIRVVDSCEVSDNNRKSINVPNGKTRNPHLASEHPMTDDAHYRDDFAYDEYEDEDASHSHASHKRPENTDLRPEHRSPSFVDEGFFSQGTFGDNFPSDFGDFLRESSSFGQKEQKDGKPSKAQSKPQEPLRPVSERPVKERPVNERPVNERPVKERPVPPAKKEESQFQDEGSFDRPFGRPSFGQSSSDDRRRPINKSQPTERPVKERPYDDFNGRDKEQESHRQPDEEDPESDVDDDNRAHQTNHQNHQQQEKETAPIKPSAPLPRIPSQKPFNPQFRQPQFNRPQSAFNPSNVVYESGFKPIRTVNGPVPTLGFEVETQQQNNEDKSKEADEKSSSIQDSADRTPISLEPIFIASEPDRNNLRSQDPVPIPLPEAVVPVVPGRAQPVPKFPPNVKPLEIPAQQRQPEQQAQRPRIPPAQPNPLFQAPGPQQTLSPFIRPPSNTPFRQSPLPPFVNHPPHQQSPALLPPQPQRKKTSALASLFNLGGQRRQQNEPQFPPPPPGAPVPPRQQLPPLAPQLPPPERRPAPPSAPRFPPEQVPGTLHQRGKEQQEQQLREQKIREQQLRQGPQLKVRAPPVRATPPLAAPVADVPKPAQGLTGLLQRILGVGDRRKDQPQSQQALNLAGGGLPRPGQPGLPGPHPQNRIAQQGPRPMMTFQGPLPPIIAAKLNAATKPNHGSPQRSDRPKNPAVLDPISASIINGGSVLGLPNSPMRVSISDAEKAQLERLLFGPGESSRSFDGMSLEDLLSNELFVSLLEAAGAEAPVEDSTDYYSEITTEETPENHDTTDDDQHTEEQEARTLDEEDVASDLADEESIVEEDIPVETQDLEVRKKRAASKEDEHKEHQHLENPDDIDSSLLPVEHRGLDDEEEHDHSESSSSSKPPTSWFLVGSSLFILIGSVQLMQRYA